MKAFAKSLLVACSIAGSAAAQEIAEMSSLDVMLQAENIQGKRLKVTGCALKGATFDFILCGITTQTGSVGNLNVKVENLDRTQLKQALENCAGLMSEKQCDATVVGIIGQGMMGPELAAEQIIWVRK